MYCMLCGTELMYCSRGALRCPLCGAEYRRELKVMCTTSKERVETWHVEAYLEVRQPIHQRGECVHGL
jgi:hypothetical protein